MGSEIPFPFLAHLFNFYLWSSDLLAHWPMAAKSNINLNHLSRTCNLSYQRLTSVGAPPSPLTSFEKYWPGWYLSSALDFWPTMALEASWNSDSAQPSLTQGNGCRSTRRHLQVQTGERKVLHTRSTAPFSWTGSGKVLVSTVHSPLPPPRCRLLF